MRPTSARSIGWKSRTRPTAGSVSQRQGCPPWDGIWRKPEAKPWPDEQKSHIRLTWDGWLCKTRRNPMLHESHTVNAAVTRNEGYCSYAGRSARYAPMRDKSFPNRVSRIERLRLNLQKSALPIVPKRWLTLTEGRGRRSATTDSWRDSYAIEISCPWRDSWLRVGWKPRVDVKSD